jgi:hypothetical protein
LRCGWPVEVQIPQASRVPIPVKVRVIGLNIRNADTSASSNAYRIICDLQYAFGLLLDCPMLNPLPHFETDHWSEFRLVEPQILAKNIHAFPRSRQGG